ncbi:hypothetical protein SCP_0605110 [Sparassis crispa]|uniref:Uncharacterized protein n=1 Tax=Sparassis crispa TaxID=139825 RepID=A0A401GQP3_9APHY|nr:hypothetical protein SCP_0605110 [Sparassis crispa]GBE84532.1 hypothetical protein SCP_0605110 [Sparassis crispa]
MHALRSPRVHARPRAQRPHRFASVSHRGLIALPPSTAHRPPLPPHRSPHLLDPLLDSLLAPHQLLTPDVRTALLAQLLRPVRFAAAAPRVKEDAEQEQPKQPDSPSAHSASAHDQHPPPPEKEEPPPPPEPDAVSDAEWELRTGRAIDVLHRTLPDFFRTGLVTSPADEVGIYSPRIRLAYTPVVPLPAPFPRTLHIEGLPLYLASSVFVRHTLNALYTDLHVELRGVRVHGPPAPPAPDDPQSAPRKIREKSLIIGLCVTGAVRVSGAPGGWQVNSTYAFSPLSGLVQTHTVDSIEPAPHQAVFDALRALGFGFGPGAGAGPVARSGGGSRCGR